MTQIDIYNEIAGAPYIKPSGPIHPDFSGEQGDLVGFDADGQLVHATAAADGTGSEADGPIACRGVLFPDHVTDLDTNEKAQMLDEFKMHMGANDTLAGEHRGAAVAHGFQIQNRDLDWGFTCGEPVYLSEDGGLTQTKPSTSGSIVQALGYPTKVGRDSLEAGETVWFDADIDYETNA